MRGGRFQVPYHVTDAAPDKRDPSWRRVVAVFVQGKDWQFRGWPFKVDGFLMPASSGPNCRYTSILP